VSGNGQAELSGAGEAERGTSVEFALIHAETPSSNAVKPTNTMNAKLVRLLPFLSLLAPNLLADPLDSWHWYPVPTGDALRAVAYGGGTFVAVGDDIVTSTNGLDWTANPTRRTESDVFILVRCAAFLARFRLRRDEPG